ncbi:MAG: hypothetical protein R3F39_01290 [Myxococcota bacterium]
MRKLLAICGVALSFAWGCGSGGGGAEDATVAEVESDSVGGAETDVAADSGVEVEVATDAAAEIEAGPDADSDGPSTGCPVGAACDDGDPCTENDLCGAGGGCAGTAMDCDDGVACTKDQCAAGVCEHALSAGFCLSEGAASLCVNNLADDPQNSCQICDASGGQAATWKSKAEGAPCDDGDACTTQDLCEIGVCKGTGSLTCTTANPCAEASCVPASGCVESPKAGPCDDGNACTGPDACADTECVGPALATACDDGDDCTVGDTCSGGACVGGPADTCDDGDPCTEDFCDPALGCQHDATAPCDDQDPCTVDSCDGGTGACTHAPFDGPCEDGDLCTSGEVCSGGACEGAEPVDCDDANPCTADSCEPTVGCRHLFLSTPCDDGVACTSVDTCVTGVCFGAKTGSCPFCDPPVSENAGRIIELAVGVDGMPGHGLDVDGDPATCAPVGECSGGVDNALAFLSLFNDTFGSAIEDGAIDLIADFNDAAFDGSAFALPVYNAVLASSNLSCQSPAQVCSYEVNQSSFDATCRAFFAFDDARIVGDKLSAGGPGTKVTIALPFQGSVLAFTLANARLEATVTLSADKSSIVMVDALVGGAAPKEQLIDAIAALDENVLPLPPEQLALVLDGAIDNDIDLDGDGVLDAASAALHIRTSPAKLK